MQKSTWKKLALAGLVTTAAATVVAVKLHKENAEFAELVVSTNDRLVELEQNLDLIEQNKLAIT